MTKLTNRATLSLLVAGLLLQACGGQSVKQTLGISKPPPDEFMVLSRPSLSVPPEFNLNPPGETAYKESDVPGNAKKTLYGSSSDNSSEELSSGESNLLTKAQTNKRNAGIREVLHEEYRERIRAKQNAGLVEGLISDSDEPDPLIDPEKEQARLKENMEQGKPVNEGEVPVIERRSKAPLEDIL